MLRLGLILVTLIGLHVATSVGRSQLPAQLQTPDKQLGKIELTPPPQIPQDVPNPEMRPDPGLPQLPAADVTLKELDMVVPLNEFLKLRSKTGADIKEASVDREAVIKIFPFEPGAKLVRAIPVGMGLARVTLIDMKNNVTVLKIQVKPDISFLNALVARQFPNSSLKLSAGGDNVVIVEGVVDAPGDIDSVVGMLTSFIGKTGAIINNIRVAGVQQIQLEVVIARVDRRTLRRMNANILAANAENFVGTQIGNLIGVPGINVRGGDFLKSANKVFSPSVGAGQVLTANSTVFFGITPDNYSIFGFLEFLQQHGVAKVLANPTLVTLNNRPADFLVGGEQPIPILTFAGGVAQPNVVFKSFGTRLTFIPVLLGDGKIRLDVLPEVSTVNFAAAINAGGTQVPQFVTQRIHTTVEMENGETLILGGLLQTEIEGQVDKVPILGSLPLVGSLFRRTNNQIRETELLVVVTPRLAMPTRNVVIDLPGNETRNPRAFELYGLGHIERPVEPARLFGRRRSVIYPENSEYMGEAVPAYEPSLSAPPSQQAPDSTPEPLKMPQKKGTPIKKVMQR